MPIPDGLGAPACPFRFVGTMLGRVLRNRDLFGKSAGAANPVCNRRGMFRRLFCRVATKPQQATDPLGSGQEVLNRAGGNQERSRDLST